MEVPRGWEVVIAGLKLKQRGSCLWNEGEIRKVYGPNGFLMALLVCYE